MTQHATQCVELLFAAMCTSQMCKNTSIWYGNWHMVCHMVCLRITLTYKQHWAVCKQQLADIVTGL